MSPQSRLVALRLAEATCVAAECLSAQILRVPDAPVPQAQAAMNAAGDVARRHRTVIVQARAVLLITLPRGLKPLAREIFSPPDAAFAQVPVAAGQISARRRNRSRRKRPAAVDAAVAPRRTVVVGGIGAGPQAAGQFADDAAAHPEAAAAKQREVEQIKQRMHKARLSLQGCAMDSEVTRCEAREGPDVDPACLSPHRCVSAL